MKTMKKKKKKMPPLAFTRSGLGLLGHATTRVALASRRNPTNSRDRIKPNLSGHQQGERDECPQLHHRSHFGRARGWIKSTWHNLAEQSKPSNQGRTFTKCQS
jgi:hypothetical protein